MYGELMTKILRDSLFQVLDIRCTLQNSLKPPPEHLQTTESAPRIHPVSGKSGWFLAVIPPSRRPHIEPVIKEWVEWSCEQVAAHKAQSTSFAWGVWLRVASQVFGVRFRRSVGRAVVPFGGAHDFGVKVSFLVIVLGGFGSYFGSFWKALKVPCWSLEV